MTKAQYTSIAAIGGTILLATYFANKATDKNFLGQWEKWVAGGISLSFLVAAFGMYKK